MNGFYAELGGAIRRRREAIGMTQAALAKHVGISRPSVTNIESGRQSLLAHQLVEFALALGVDPISLLPENVEEKKHPTPPRVPKEMMRLLRRLNVGTRSK